MVGPDGGWELAIAKFFTPEQAQAVNEELKANTGDLLLFVADSPEIAPAAIGALRAHLAERFGLIEGQSHDALWIVDFPMFSWDGRAGRWDPLHHPFTAPAMAGDPRAAVSFEDPAALRSRAYDLVVDGVEIGGGSIRIHEQQLQQDVLQALGMDATEAQARFGFLLEALKYGAPPHGGIAFGIDRILALCAGRESIRDVIAFPKTASGADPLTGAPSTVEDSQLRDLGVGILAAPAP
jgi:aspartyl-tRNA synthetase